MFKKIIIELYNDDAIKNQSIKGIIKESYPHIFNEISTLSIDGSFIVKVYCYLHNFDSRPLCNCGKLTSFVSMTKGFSKTCSYKCMGQIETTKEKRAITTLGRYGVSNISLVTRDKAIDKMRNKSNEEREIINQKVKSTSLLRYGVDNINKLKSISERKRKTNLEKYGYAYPTQSPVLVALRTKNNIEKYGVSNPIQVPEIFEKQQQNMFKTKDYIWKSGDISKVQGYEHLVLMDLESLGYCFSQVKTKPSEIPAIFYTHNNKRKRYFPDIYLPEENKIIEVKSKYTNQCNQEINLLKYAAVKSMGFIFELIVK